MATTGTFIANPTLAEHTDEAVERAGINPESLSGEQLISIRRSMVFAFSKWSNLGHKQWKFTRFTFNPVSIGQTEFDLPAGTMWVQTAVHQRSGVDTEMYPISREDYSILHDKDLVGRSDRYFVERRRDDLVSNPVRVFLWPAVERLTDIMVFDIWQQYEDPGNPRNTLDIPYRFYDAYAAELAKRVAQKYKPERFKELKAEAMEAWDEADDEDRDLAPLIISANYSRRHGRP